MPSRKEIMNLYDEDNDQFTRGVHEEKDILTVAKTEPEYLIFLLLKTSTDQTTLNLIEQFVEDNPELFEDYLY